MPRPRILQDYASINIYLGSEERKRRLVSLARGPGVSPSALIRAWVDQMCPPTEAEQDETRRSRK